MGESDDKLALVLRIVTFLCGIGLIALSIVSFLQFTLTSPKEFFLRIYYILFGILVCLSEMPCERFMAFFYFLKTYLGKCLFFLFLATITFRWDPAYYLVISIVFFAATGLYFVLFISCSNRNNAGNSEPQQPKFEKRDVENP